MSPLDDDGISLDLSTVLVFFLLPNGALIILTIFNVCLLYISRKRPRLNRALGKLANIFAKGALDRIIKDIVRHIEVQKRQYEEQAPTAQPSSLGLPAESHTTKRPSSATSLSSTCEKKYDANYLLLVPFQMDLLLTVFVYKILTRDVYFETCNSYLTTYHNRPNQVICWLKNANRNVSNSSLNSTLYQYCLNQTITYTNYEHNDVMCTQYVFKSINIIDTVTNIFAWHQAVVFLVTKAIVFAHWYQQALRKSTHWPNFFGCERRIIVSLLSGLVICLYVVLFVFLLPIRFIVVDRQRVDLTRHLLYACSKFVVGIIVHINIYAFYQWQALSAQKQQLLLLHRKPKLHFGQFGLSEVPSRCSIYASVPDSIPVSDPQLVAESKHSLPTSLA